MPNIGALLKEEIRRLAKREARSLMASLRKDNARLKRTAAQFKRSLAALERNTRRLVAEADARLQALGPQRMSRSTPCPAVGGRS
ncbi:MAG TPA: hypothetical protein PK280_21065 [Planctomycetota bacterium]|nr:hypothetical protein [Planctomycetota bacterium]